MTADEVEPMSLLIKALDLAEVILETHQPDATGQYCTACSKNLTVKWPCSLRFYATEALALDEGTT